MGLYFLRDWYMWHCLYCASLGWDDFVHIVIEDKGSMNGIRRSWELTKGQGCFILALLFCFTLMENVVYQLLRTIFFSRDTYGVLFLAAGTVVTLIPALLFFPIKTM